MRTVVRTLVLLGVVLLVAGVAVWAQAPAGGDMQQMPHGQMGQGQGRGQGMHGPGGPMAMFTQLNLTDQQKQEIHKLMADTQPQQQADMEQMQKLHEQLKAQVFADAGPTRDASALAQEVNTLQGKMVQSHIALAEKISAILTPEQRKQLREMPMDDMMGMMRMMGGPGPMMGHGGPPKK